MATILRVHDGDSFLADVDLGFHVRKKMWLRLAGVDTPEMDTIEGKQSREFVLGWLYKGDLSKNPTVEINTVRDLRGDEKTTFGRYVAHVYDAFGESLSAAIIDQGFGKAIKA
jgi:endonuclease YncB( thermonuclease family)